MWIVYLVSNFDHKLIPDTNFIRFKDCPVNTTNAESNPVKNDGEFIPKHVNIDEEKYKEKNQKAISHNSESFVSTGH
jgi:hypothetical protein